MEIARIVEGLWGSNWSPSMDLEPDNMCDTVLLEHSHLVVDRFPEKSFYLDRFPLQIKDPTVFEQINIFFDKTEDHPNLHI